MGLADSRSYRRWIVLLVVLGVLLRLGLVVVFPQEAPDAGRYHATALNIASGKGFSSDGHGPTADSAPLYPVLLALLHRVHPSLFLARLVQALLDCGTCLLVFKLSQALGAPRRTCLLSLGIACFYPSLAASTAFVLTETVFTFLCTGFTYCLLRAWRSGRLFPAAKAAVFLGLATLTRGTTLMLGPFLFLTLPLSGKKRKRALVLAALLVAGTIVLVAPWTIRNYVAFGEFLPVAVGAGGNLWLGSYLPWDGDYNYQDLSDKKKLEEGLSWSEADRKLKEEAIKNIKADPGGYGRLAVKKLWRYWFLVPGRKELLKDKPFLRGALYVVHYLLLGGCLLALPLLAKKGRQEFLPVVLVIVYFTLFHMALFAIPRYAIPVIPLAIVISSRGIGSLLLGGEK